MRNIVLVGGKGFLSFRTPSRMWNRNDNHSFHFIHFSSHSLAALHSFMSELIRVFFWDTQIYEKLEYFRNYRIWEDNTDNKLGLIFIALSKSASKYRVFLKKKTYFCYLTFLWDTLYITKHFLNLVLWHRIILIPSKRNRALRHRWNTLYIQEFKPLDLIALKIS